MPNSSEITLQPGTITAGGDDATKAAVAKLREDIDKQFEALNKAIAELVKQQAQATKKPE